MKNIVSIIFILFSIVTIYGQKRTVFFEYSKDDFERREHPIIKIKDSFGDKIYYLSRLDLEVIDKKFVDSIDESKILNFRQTIRKENLYIPNKNIIDIGKLVNFMKNNEVILVSKETEGYCLTKVQCILWSH